jgi:hypothetical protein
MSTTTNFIAAPVFPLASDRAKLRQFCGLNRTDALDDKKGPGGTSDHDF